MKTNFVMRWRRSLRAGAAVLVMLLLSQSAPGASDNDPLLAGMAPAEIMRLGENMYRNGTLPSGEPVQAVVQGDIPVAGTMFTCANCHMRSGVGSIEGTIITPPTNGAELYRPKKPGARHSEAQEQRRPAPFITPHDRPAYTDASLGHVLASGIDPAGSVLDPIMPRYLLEPRDLAILVHYLKNLSADLSPGVSEETLDFATIVAGDVDPADRDAMLMPLKLFIANRNARVPLFQGRKRTGIFAEEMDLSYRKLSLSVWELTGTPDTWRSQLEAYYRKKPVFAVLGGIAKGDWLPIHAFCNQNGIPCIMPSTDKPVLSEDNWYVLYLSRGPAQEGESAARFLHMRKDLAGDAGRIVQVYRDRGKGPVIARAFRETLLEMGLLPPREVVVKAGAPLDAGLLKGMGPGVVAALWLDADDLARMRFADKRSGPATILASGGMLGERLNAVPDQVRRSTYITYPYRLPKDRKATHQVVTTWLKQNRIPASNLRISADVYAMGSMLTDVFMHMKRNYYRDHFLDVFDMQRDQTYTVLNYPRLSFGPGQRYASKGCYLVQLTEGPAPELVPMTDWVAH
jgi:hypothetical protein